MTGVVNCGDACSGIRCWSTTLVSMKLVPVMGVSPLSGAPPPTDWAVGVVADVRTRIGEGLARPQG